MMARAASAISFVHGTSASLSCHYLIASIRIYIMLHVQSGQQMVHDMHCYVKHCVPA